MRRIFPGLLILCIAIAVSCAHTGDPQAIPAGSLDLPIKVYVPKGQGPFPAMVVLHHCRGIRSVTVEWTQRLVGWGYVVAVPDSFTPRGFPGGVCGDGSKVGFATRAADAYRALHVLEQRSDVIAGRIGMIGHSHGGMTALATGSNALAKTARTQGEAAGTFRVAVAFYPWCGDDRTAYTYGNGATYLTAVPTLILAGALDDWTPAVPCEQLASGAKRANQPVEITVYPGAHHSFDGTAPVVRVPEARKGKGATIGGDPAARAASITATREFLVKHLAPPRAQ